VETRLEAPEWTELPLRSVRVVDMTDDVGAMCGRYLADLGADVTLIEPPGGLRIRRQPPLADGMSLRFATQHANKRSLTIDVDDPVHRHRFLDLVDGADILIDGQPPGRLDAAKLSSDQLRARNPRLVVTSITPFGKSGPYRDWVATDAVHLALSSVLSRSGLPGREPLIPPGRLADEHAAVQAAWSTLVAYWHSVRTGAGQDVDVSVLEAVTYAMDPAFGIAGSAMADLKPSDLPAGRPDARHMYPVFACADGHVRICMLAARQWRGMFAWLGQPAEFADPRYDNTFHRFRDSHRLYKLIADLFSGKTRAQLRAAGQRHGVPIEPVNTPADALVDEHFAERHSFIDLELPGGRVARVPRGCIEIDGRPVGIHTPAGTPLKQANLPDVTSISPSHHAPSDMPALSGLRVLDLGVIVVGAETGRLFADLGADVIKVESADFPDGSRQSSAPGTINASVAWGHRNKRSLGIDLRHPTGKALFLKLVAESDIVLTNFKPGTMEALGLSYDVLREVNPGIVMVDSSALGSTGPASRRMGYGPLVRAFTGLTSIWRYPDLPGEFCDSITVYPDHAAARIGALGALALLLRRMHIGTGGTVSVAQAEVMLTQFAAEFGAESLEPGSMTPAAHSGWPAPAGAYPCAGDDQWCVVTVRDDDDWARLCAAVGADELANDPTLATQEGRRRHRDLVDERLSEWTRLRSPEDAMTLLQGAGIPAGAMRRVNELLRDPHLAARNTFSTLRHRDLGELPTERSPAKFSRLADPPMRPAPLAGADTRAVAAELLGLDDTAIETLIAERVLQDGSR
jgi:crotonobetainyl-CoA:carnitine CoA-transferase CaiB-like acyl-CoA transferase